MADTSFSVQQGTQEAKRKASGDWLEVFGRVGYVAKGVVYIIVGVLAVQAAFGAGGSAEGSRGAIREIAQQPFGQVLLVLTALGLACYAVWRLVLATLDPKDKGTDAEGVGKRLGYAASGIANLLLAVFAASIALGSGSGGSGGGSGGSSQQTMTAELLSQPFGQWLVAAIGAIVVGVGLYHFYRTYKASFMKKYKAGEMSATQRKWAKRIGQAGLSARGVTFCIIGSFLIQAALQHDSSETGGLDKALQTLAQQPYGPWLLGAVAIGFVCYGIYCFSYARYRRFETN